MEKWKSKGRISTFPPARFSYSKTKERRPGGRVASLPALQAHFGMRKCSISRYVRRCVLTAGRLHSPRLLTRRTVGRPPMWSLRLRVGLNRMGALFRGPRPRRLFFRRPVAHRSRLVAGRFRYSLLTRSWRKTLNDQSQFQLISKNQGRPLDSRQARPRRRVPPGWK